MAHRRRRCCGRSRTATTTFSTCVSSRSGHRQPVAAKEDRGCISETYDHRSTHLQLLRRAGRDAAAGAGRDPAQSDLAAGRRHVDSRNQPSFEGVRSDPRAGGSRHAPAGRHSVELSRALSPGRREPAVLDGADEPADAGRDRRLHRLRILGREGDQGSEEGRHRERRRHHEGRELLARAAAVRAEADAGRRVRAHDVEQHDRRHRVQGSCPRSATSRSSATRRPTCSAGRSTSRATR